MFSFASGSLGNQVAAATSVWTPTKVNWPAPFNTKEAVQVAASDGTTAVLFTDGTAVVSGLNSQYQLCETTANIIVPRAHILSNLRAIYAGPVHNAYVVGNGSIYFCGFHTYVRCREVCILLTLTCSPAQGWIFCECGCHQQSTILCSNPRKFRSRHKLCQHAHISWFWCGPDSEPPSLHLGTERYR
jgi:hypothetical protein